MKAMGDIFLSQKRSRRGKMYSTFKLSGKRTIAGQNSGKFFNKHRRGKFQYFGKISQVKRQGKKFRWNILPFFILTCISIKKY